MTRRLGPLLATTWLGLLAISAATASWLPIDPNRFDSLARLSAPSWHHPFGTTRLGEDLFALCVHVAVVVGVGAALLAALIGLPLGLTAGYLGGRADATISLVVDAALALPAFIVSVVLVTAFGASVMSVIVVIGLVSAPFVARVSRSAARALADRDFVIVARSLGARPARIMWVELRPNLVAPMASLLALVSGAAILVEGGLSYVGLGVPLGNASWGRLIAGGREELATAWWWSLIPSLLFFFTVLAVNVLADHWQGARLRRPRERSVGRPSGVIIGTVLDEALVVSNLTVSLAAHPDQPIVSNFDLCVRRGELVALVGPSGVGKTTIARAICGVLDNAMVGTGSIQTAETRGHRAALVMQEPRRSLNPVTRIGRQIAEPARVHLGLSRSEAWARAEELLTLVGVSEPSRRMRSYAHELSGGQCQRVAIALALASEPGVLIADEPTASLDPLATRATFDLFDTVRRETGVAILVITHDMASARLRADRIVELR
jgi:peptide/nickel transport system permease protein